MENNKTPEAVVNNIEALTITWYQLWSGLTVKDPSVPIPEYETTCRIELLGDVNPPYTISQIQIKFVPDNRTLARPDYMAPALYCEMHQSDYTVVTDLLTRGVDNKKPGTSFQAQFIINIGQLDMYVST